MKHQMRVSQCFNIRKTQAELDFVDVTLHTDTRVFVDPTAIRLLKSTWGQECLSLLQRYFDLILSHIRSGSDDRARRLISCLNERNEFHTGYSKGKSRGHAWGTESASWVWEALKASKASTTGMLRDLEDTALTLEGVGPDMISDAVCNIIRGPLIRYTHDMCSYYGIPLEGAVPSGPIWNPQTGEWEERLIPLPMTPQGTLVLIPKVLVRHKITYDPQKYYTHYLLPQMQVDEIIQKTALVHLLKDKTPKVYKKDLRKKYGSGKLAIVDQTANRREILTKYKESMLRNVKPPLKHEEFAEIEGVKRPNWEQMLARLLNIAPGTDHAKEYEDCIEGVLTALFYPSLCHPTKQDRIHEGRKIVDITYVNEGKNGVFSWLAMHWPAAFVMVECKNYASEVDNPALDQLAGRFSPSRGQVGILVCRKVENRQLIDRKCLDTARDRRGLIVVLDDDDIAQLVRYVAEQEDTEQHPLLADKYRRLAKD